MGAVETEGRPPNVFKRTIHNIIGLVDGPVDWFRETVIEPNRTDYNWYHKKFRRVPTIDQCYRDDQVCRFEAEQQFKRDKLVENGILWILRRRFEECVMYESPDRDREVCKPLYETYNDALENWFIKYGDLGGYGGAYESYMKQKHRMVWERRYGPVGTGKIPIAEREAQVPRE